VVADRQRDPIAGLHASRRESIREGVRSLVELLERERAPVPDEGRLGRKPTRPRFEQMDEVRRHRVSWID
jgi:hypothetical protein